MQIEWYVYCISMPALTPWLRVGGLGTCYIYMAINGHRISLVTGNIYSTCIYVHIYVQKGKSLYLALTVVATLPISGNIVYMRKRFTSQSLLWPLLVELWWQKGCRPSLLLLIFSPPSWMGAVECLTLQSSAQFQQ